MTFQKVFVAPGLGQNERVSSNQFNAFDGYIAKAIDKTGDNIGNGGGITGQIDVLNLGSIDFQSGGSLIISPGSDIDMEGTFVTQPGSTSTFGGAANLNSTTEINGAAIVESGGTLAIASGGNMDILAGSNVFVNQGNAISITDSTDIQFVPPRGRVPCKVFDTNMLLPTTSWEYNLGIENYWPFLATTASGGVITQQLNNLPQGATLYGVNVYISVAAHSVVPSLLPTINVFRVPLPGSLGTAVPAGSPLASPASFPTPGSASAYVDGFAVQSWTFVSSAPNNVIDNNNFAYILQVFDESGAGSTSGNQYLGYSVTITNITNYSW